MSGIAGRIELHGRPLDRDLLLRMSAMIAHRGPDAAGIWTQGSTGLCHRQFCTTPESLGERQPWADSSGRVCLAMDGRVDNREEIAAAVEARGAMLRCRCDAELVLQAYLCWGEDFAARILGDFALAVWDGRSRRLVCARDILGMKPLCYFVDDAKFLWCSEIRPLFADPAVPRKANEAMVGEFLTNSLTSLSETLFERIYCLPPAHVLVFDADHPEAGPRVRRYWDFDPAAKIACRDDREYADRLRELVREAVRCRLRSQVPVGLELSGGLDSSFVACMAGDLARREGAAAAGLETFSLVFPGSECDESRYIDAAAAQCGLPSNRVGPHPLDFAWQRQQVARDWLPPDYPNSSMSASLKGLAADKGFRVLLTGLGGDEWFWGSPEHYADLLRTLRFGDFFRLARSDSAVPTLAPRPSNPLLSWAIGPLVPRRLRAILRAVRGSRRVPSWIPAEFARAISHRQRQYVEAPSPCFASYAQADHYRLVFCGSYQRQMDLLERSSMHPTIEYRHPFHDRRIIEFSLALPEEQKWRAGQHRFVLREAMGDLVPDIIRQRTTKAEFSEIVVGALRATGGRQFFDSLKIADLGWVDPRQVGQMYRQLEQDQAGQSGHGGRLLWPLWRILGMELWFSSVFGEGDNGDCLPQPTPSGRDTMDATRGCSPSEQG
jgi:asparagine synthase (glutamine-hydrolysing)